MRSSWAARARGDATGLTSGRPPHGTGDLRTGDPQVGVRAGPWDGMGWRSPALPCTPAPGPVRPVGLSSAQRARAGGPGDGNTSPGVLTPPKGPGSWHRDCLAEPRPQPLPARPPQTPWGSGCLEPRPCRPLLPVAPGCAVGTRQRLRLLALPALPGPVRPCLSFPIPPAPGSGICSAACGKSCGTASPVRGRMRPDPCSPIRARRGPTSMPGAAVTPGSAVPRPPARTRDAPRGPRVPGVR